MKEIGRYVLVLTAIAAGAAMVLALVERATREPITEQRRQQLLRAVQAVLPPVDNAPDEDTVSLVTGQDRRGREVLTTFYRGRREGALVGIAFPVTAPDGYSGDIDVMVGVDSEGRVLGIEVIRHAETPGLGDKIHEPWFRKQFVGEGAQTDWRVRKDGGPFEQLTGATISARAVVGAVGRGVEFFQANRRQILAEGEGT